MKTQILNGEFTGTRPPSQYWEKQGVIIPVVKCSACKPVFHESGYASGHAHEVLSVPGLLAQIETLAAIPANDAYVHFSQGAEYKTGWCWAHVEWADKPSLVFLAHVYDGRNDVYTLTN